VIEFYSTDDNVALSSEFCVEFSSIYSKVSKVGRAPPERRRGAHLPFKAIEPVGG